MGYVVRMPSLGMQMSEGTVLEWFADVGDAVESGDVLLEIESDKATSDIEAMESGELKRKYAHEGETIKVGHPLGILAETETDAAALEQELDTGEQESESTSDRSEAATARGNDAAEGEGVAKEQPKATPKAKKCASELDVDLSKVEGTGLGGAITAEDVERAQSQEATGGSTTKQTVAEERPLTGTRKTISDRLGQSYRDAIHVTTHLDVDAEALFAAKEQADAVYSERISLMDVLLLAVSETLSKYPAFNGTFEDGTHRIYQEQNVGIAVDDEDGLVVPVIPDIADTSLPDLATLRRDSVNRVKEGEYSYDDLTGGTFTVSNVGVFDVDAFTPIINPPQVAILGVGTPSEKAVRADEEIEFRRQLPLDLSFDHRVLDGADAARFLSALKDAIEDPWQHLPDEVRQQNVQEEAIQLPDRVVSVHSEGGLSGTVTAGSFEWQVDEPVNVGGSGTAPTPVDRFLGALSSCLAVSIGVQAEKKDIALSGVDIDMHGYPERGRIERIEGSVTLVSDADEQTLDRLVELGERACYVADLLRDDLEIDVTRRD